MDSDERLSLLVSYCYFGYQNIDLDDLLKTKDDTFSPYANLRDNFNHVDEDCKACFLGFLTRYESSYLMYAYKFKGKEYGFAWETYFEDMQNDNDLESELSWYNFIEQGQMFKIKVDSQNPFSHFITEKPFSAMNGMVIQLGPCRDALDNKA